MEDNSAKRSKNFSKQELEVLVEEVVSRQRMLMGKLDNVVTADNKKRAWAKVAQSVSAVGETERDAIAIKKKWEDVKSLVKKKAAERARETRKTGGGMSSVKQRTERLGGEDFGSYRGISGRRRSRRGGHWRPQLYAAATADTYG